ncbi:MAG: hypothetical protein HW373_387, partial [Deltaproteobacteria bacterium]|nr:hypothetical protein [Deltaproteobacteria bacterium]
CNGIDAGDGAAVWLSRVLGDRLRLVRMNERVPRLANPLYAGPKPHPITPGLKVCVSFLSLSFLHGLTQIRRKPDEKPTHRT